MSRGDIANYLRLAAETVSRVLSRFRSQKLIQVEGRQLEILDPQGLHHIGRSLLQD
jgi:CRP/FNR family transcriptional regulator